MLVFLVFVLLYNMLRIDILSHKVSQTAEYS